MAASTVVRRNFPYFRQQLGAALNNSSVVVKFICVTVFSCYFLSYSELAIRVLSVTPGYLIPPSTWIWTAFTHCFVETHFWQVAADIVTVGLCGKLMEPLWGAQEMLTFFAIVNVGVALTSTAYYLFVYMCTFNPAILFEIHIHGLAGYVAGVSVAVKQIMPDHVLIHSPLGKMRNRNVPLNVLLLSLILWSVGLLEGTYSCMFLSGVLVSWLYLRFFQPHSNGSSGDIAESFTFASFFPNVLQPPIAIVCNTIYEFLVKLKICHKPIKHTAIPSSITISLPGTDPHDAERRRQIAIKALNDRLNKPEPARWPSLIDEKSPETTLVTTTATTTSSPSTVIDVPTTA
uniref:Transmembrane protein 115 n=1 Tax=Strigamia maritima TaxID=126957 RepID=T1IMS9_STRMM